MNEHIAESVAGTQLVRQEHTWGCGVAALAMVTGQTYDEVRTWILDNWVYNVTGRETPDGWLTEHGVTQYVLDWYLGEHGFAWRRLYRAWTDADSWPPKPFAPVHVAQVVQPSGNAHFVVLTAAGRVLDPMSDEPRSLTDWEQINFVQGVWRRPSFDDLLNDPTQQLDSEGVVLQAVLEERERDRLRSEGWRACVDHLQREYHRAADRWPDKVPVVERLEAGMAGAGAWPVPHNIPRVNAMQDALREFANPTPIKPDEPQGLGAVVEDDRGVRWVRTEPGNGLTNPWQATLHVAETDDVRSLRWAEVVAVKVLSEGVTQ